MVFLFITCQSDIVVNKEGANRLSLADTRVFLYNIKLSHNDIMRHT